MKKSTSKSNDIRVKGYERKDGTKVGGHYRTNPNGSKRDNYSTSGNYNPHTSKIGTKTSLNSS